MVTREIVAKWCDHRWTDREKGKGPAAVATCPMLLKPGTPSAKPEPSASYHFTSTPSRMMRPCRIVDGRKYVAAPNCVDEIPV